MNLTTFISERPINISGKDKIHLKTAIVAGSILYGAREPIPYSFGFDKLPHHKKFENLKIKHHKKLIKSKNNEKTFYLEDDDRNSVGFPGEVKTFNLQFKIYFTNMNLNTYRPKNKADELRLPITKI